MFLNVHATTSQAKIALLKFVNELLTTHGANVHYNYPEQGRVCIHVAGLATTTSSEGKSTTATNKVVHQDVRDKLSALAGRTEGLTFTSEQRPPRGMESCMLCGIPPRRLSALPGQPFEVIPPPKRAA